MARIQFPWKSRLRFLSIDDFGRKVAKVAGGSVVAQLIMLAALPLLTRLYPTAEFGVFGVYGAILAICGTVAGGRYDIAIPIPRKDVEAWQLLKLTALLCLVFVVGVIAVFGFWIPSELSTLQWCAFLLPFHICCVTCNSAMFQWMCRKNEFTWVLWSRITRASVAVFVQLVCGFSVEMRGLVIGSFAGAVALVVVNFVCIYRTRPLIEVDRLSLWHVAKRHYRFPSYLLPANCLNALSRNVPVLIISAFFGSVNAGYFTVAMRVLGVPLQLISRSIGQVFYPEAARSYSNSGECVDLFKAVVKRTFVVGSAGLCIFAVIAPTFMAVVMGDQWREAGYIVQILAPLLIIRFVASPVAAMWIITEKQALNFVWQVFLIGMIACGLAFGGMVGKWHGAIAGYGLSIALAYGIEIFICSGFAKGPRERVVVTN